MQEWFELDTRKVVRGGQVWRLLTHAFCHERIAVWHIAFNMLFLYWFGCTIESMYGSREFLLFYLTAAIVAALAFVGLDLATGSTAPGIGASGAVMAVTMLYALHYPYETICVFWVVRIEMRWLMIAFVVFDLHPLLLALSGDRFFTGVAHAAHLGGLLFGFLYGWYEWRLATLLDRIPGVRRLGLPAKPRRFQGLHGPNPVLRLRPDPEMDRVDQLLAKISESGGDSLTDDERDYLQRASARLKKRRDDEG